MSLALTSCNILDSPLTYLSTYTHPPPNPSLITFSSPPQTYLFLAYYIYTKKNYT